MIPAANLKSTCLWKCFPNSGEGGEPSGLFRSLVVLLKAPRSDSTCGTGFLSGRDARPLSGSPPSVAGCSGERTETGS